MLRTLNGSTVAVHIGSLVRAVHVRAFVLKTASRSLLGGLSGVGRLGKLSARSTKQKLKTIRQRGAAVASSSPGSE